MNSQHHPPPIFDGLVEITGHLVLGPGIECLQYDVRACQSGLQGLEGTVVGPFPQGGDILLRAAGTMLVQHGHDLPGSRRHAYHLEGRIGMEFIQPEFALLHRQLHAGQEQFVTFLEQRLFGILQRRAAIDSAMPGFHPIWRGHGWLRQQVGLDQVHDPVLQPFEPGLTLLGIGFHQLFAQFERGGEPA